MIGRTKNICFFSGKRGGFGAYVPLMRLVERDPEFKLQILLADMHASELFGATKREAQELFPDATIEVMDIGTGRGDSPKIRAENLGKCLQEAAGVLERLGSDLVFVHADRGEHLMVAFAALNLGIPVAHTQGGEQSGNIDDVQRHAITKVAHLHFPETEKAAQHLRLLGEEEWRVFTVGSMYVDRIVQKIFTPNNAARVKAGLSADEPYFVSIYHPETGVSSEENYRRMKELIGVLKSFEQRSVLLYPCSDPGHEGIIRALREAEGDEHFLVHKNIFNYDFLGLLAGAQLLVGNSSSGVVEAPYLKIPVVNIGDRQTDRTRDKNVIDVSHVPTDIKKGIERALFDKEFRIQLASCGGILGDGTASKKIYEVLKKMTLDKRLLDKKLNYRGVYESRKS